MEEPTYEVNNLGHLGIIASIFKEYGIIEKIDSLLPPKTSANHKITHGQAIFAMVLQGLGFSKQRLYLSPEYLSHVAVAELFGPNVKAEYFNSDRLDRTLDAIYKYGATRFFTDSCLKIVLTNNLIKKFLFADSTSFHVTGKKYKNNGRIELKHGYNKDYRMDLGLWW